jgi:mannose PTS system EIIA component
VTIGAVLIVHGSYGGHLLEAARAIAGPLPAEVLEVMPGTDRDELRRRMEDAIRRQEQGAGVVILVDICGSTPCFVGLTIQASNPGAAVVTGLSLSMLLKLATTHPSLSLTELAAELSRSAQRSVQLGSDLLHKGAPGGC